MSCVRSATGAAEARRAPTVSCWHPAGGVPAQAPIRFDGKYSAVVPAAQSGTIYEIPVGGGGCAALGTSDYFTVDLSTELTKPADVEGPITLSRG